MANYAEELMALTDEQLAVALISPQPDSPKHEQIKFEMQRRAMKAQKDAAEATKRSAVAAERYTFATWVLILVTVIGLLINTFSK
jgi:hypothetical protein